MRVELSRTGDYAVRACLLLARARPSHVTAATLAAETGIPRSYVAQVMAGLVRNGIVANRRGRSGGYRLARPAREVSLLAVIQAVEGDLRRRTCVLRGGPCGSRGSHCSVHEAFAQAQDAAARALASASLADAAGTGR